jgi:hypothetical protein
MKDIFAKWNKFINENKNFGDKNRGGTNETNEVPLSGMQPAPDAETQDPRQYVATLLRQMINNIGRVSRDELPSVADEINGAGIEGLNARFTDGSDISSPINPRQASYIPTIVVEVPNGDRKVFITTRRDADAPSAVVGTLAIN